jgi:pyrimidine operon attenuation protein/uracil phosphoribosyltransferase
MEKEQLIQIVIEWVKRDGEIKELQRQKNIRQVEQKKINTQLMEIMKLNKIDCFDIKDEQIQYKKKQTKKAITKKSLLLVLGTFYNGDVKKVEELNSFILENREDNVIECIVRKSNVIKALHKT